MLGGISATHKVSSIYASHAIHMLDPQEEVSYSPEALFFSAMQSHVVNKKIIILVIIYHTIFLPVFLWLVAKGLCILLPFPASPLHLVMSFSLACY